MNRIIASLLLLVALFLATNLCCNRGGNILMVGGISGPDEVPEGSTVEYFVDTESSTGFTYNWAVDPVGFGILGSPEAASTTFTAPDVDSDFEIVIRVVVNYDNNGPVVRSMDVTVRDIDNPDDPPINLPPVAAAHANIYDTEPGVEIQFFDDSTDPDGNDDIVKWEWDFSYDPGDGFQVDSTEKDPVQSWPMEGAYLVQHRVEDSSGLSDLLDEPLVIIVEPAPQPPVAAAHAETYSGQPGVEIQFFDDSTDPNDDIVFWEWDFSYDPDDGFQVESMEKEPIIEFAETGVFDIQLQVTDSAGLSDMLDMPIQITVIHEHPVASFGFTFGSDPASECAEGIGIDPSGNIYVAGKAGSTWFDLDPGDDIYELEVDNSAFICMYDQSDFHVIEATHWKNAYISAFTTDKNGNFYITGEYQGSDDGPYIRSVTPADLNNWETRRHDWYYYDYMWNGDNWGHYYFSPVACLTDGTIYYVEYNKEYYFHMGTMFASYIRQGSPVDFNENVWENQLPVGCEYAESIGASNSGILILLNEYWLSDSRLSHFSLDGELQWEIQSVKGADFTPIQTDAQDLYYIVNINGKNVTIISPDSEIIRELDWAAGASNIYVNDSGSFLVTGIFTETVDFDPGPEETFKSSPGTVSGYISFFDQDWNFRWVETWGNSEDMSVRGICADNSGNIYVCGYFTDTIDLGPPSQSDIHYSNGGRDAFVLKLSQ